MDFLRAIYAPGIPVDAPVSSTGASFECFILYPVFKSEQPEGLAALVYVHGHRRGTAGQSWHGLHLAAQRVEKTGAYGGPDIPYRQAISLGHALEVGVGGGWQLGLGH